MLTEHDFKVIQAFVSDCKADCHIYGSATVCNREGEKIGTLPINSATESSCDYFLSGESICGYSYSCISEIQLTKGNSYFTIANKSLHG